MARTSEVLTPAEILAVEAINNISNNEIAFKNSNGDYV
jgi:hypothetical protein